MKLLEKEELLEKERLGPLAKKKGFVKKRKRIEERMLVEDETEGEKVGEKEVGVQLQTLQTYEKEGRVKDAEEDRSDRPQTH